MVRQDTVSSLLSAAFVLVLLLSMSTIAIARNEATQLDRDFFNHHNRHFSYRDPSETIPSRQRTEAAIEADNFFWFAFNNGRYDLIDQVLNALVGAYLIDPEDPLTAGHIGSTHLWRLSEQSRLDDIPPTITDSVIIARKYLRRSVDLFPNAIFLGQLGGLTILEGQTDFNDARTKDGFKVLTQSILDWPEFNLLTPGFLFSRIFPPGNQIYKQSLEMQWQNYELCVGEKINRDDPDFTPFLTRETLEGRKRVCWNSDKAPHNLEGFFMNMGDMLVKAGDWNTAQKIYANARVIPGYSTWKYRSELEERIINAPLNVSRFNAAPDGSTGAYKPVLSAESYSCAVCHQK
ncbi:hypothetical protein SAMN05421690_10053 [Nitrosomonas sp. Nm51]|nr:hypothetical protein SAMN05421690_10053 [Nitrosomonas sp. Nm51]